MQLGNTKLLKTILSAFNPLNKYFVKLLLEAAAAQAILGWSLSTLRCVTFLLGKRVQLCLAGLDIDKRQQYLVMLYFRPWIHKAL